MQLRMQEWWYQRNGKKYDCTFPARVFIQERRVPLIFSYVVFCSSGGLFSSFFTSTQFFTQMAGGNKKLKENALKQQLSKHYSLQVKAIQVSHKTSQGFLPKLSGGYIRGRLAVLVLRQTHVLFSQDSQENIGHHSRDLPTPWLGAPCIPPHQKTRR